MAERLISQAFLEAQISEVHGRLVEARNENSSNAASQDASGPDPSDSFRKAVEAIEVEINALQRLREVRGDAEAERESRIAPDLPESARFRCSSAVLSRVRLFRVVLLRGRLMEGSACGRGGREWSANTIRRWITRARSRKLRMAESF